MRVAVEVCVTSVEEALAAERCGADSVELCTWLACGGVTSSLGLVKSVLEHVSIPVRVLVRPTPGGFRYSREEGQVMLNDVDVLAGLQRIHGIVIGALDEADLPDRDLLEHALGRSGGMEATFHRAIDRSADPLAVFDRCATMDLHRVLTSGGATLAADGMKNIALMVDRSQDRIRVAAAGGINAENVVRLVEQTGVGEVHFAAQRAVDEVEERVALSSSHPTGGFRTVPDVAKIERVLDALSKARLR